MAYGIVLPTGAELKVGKEACNAWHLKSFAPANLSLPSGTIVEVIQSTKDQAIVVVTELPDNAGDGEVIVGLRVRVTYVYFDNLNPI